MGTGYQYVVLVSCDFVFTGNRVEVVCTGVRDVICSRRVRDLVVHGSPWFNCSRKAVISFCSRRAWISFVHGEPWFLSSRRAVLSGYPDDWLSKITGWERKSGCLCQCVRLLCLLFTKALVPLKDTITYLVEELFQLELVVSAGATFHSEVR